MTPREQLVVAAWETRRMVAALLLADLVAPPPPLVRPLLGGLGMTGLVVAAFLVR